MGICITPGCNQVVSKLGHKWCYEHWKAENARVSASPATTSKPIHKPQLISVTKISKSLGFSRNQINPILAELGLIDKVPNGWLATCFGLSFGAIQKCDKNNGSQYVLWPETILTEKIFDEFRKSNDIENEAYTISNSAKKIGFRQNFKAGDYRARDGHWVRSRAEVLIDNFLYMGGIVHAYERKLPVEEEAYCDFYIPTEKIYIEYWGYEQNQKYLQRKQEKQQLYKKYNFKLIELSDEHIKNLDDHLPQTLRKFGVSFD